MVDIYSLKKDELELFIENNKKHQTNPYIIRNRGSITASMLKAFEKSTEAFFKQYICEIEPVKQDKPSLSFGTMVDDYVSYWEKWFFEKYYIDEGWKVDDLRDMCMDDMLSTEWLKTDLEKRLFWDKQKITPSDYIKFKWVIWEWERQPLFDYEWGYETQKEIIVPYKWLKLKVTLDRLLVEKWLLRDMKTTNNLKKFNFQVIDYWYDFSMSFYNIICKIEYKRDFTVILDACQSTYPFPSSSIVIPQPTIVNMWRVRIIPAMEKLAWYMAQWKKNKNPNVWLEEEIVREELYWLDMYPVLESSLQTEFEIFQ